MGDDWLSRFLAGETPPHLALMQLFISTPSEDNAKQALRTAISNADSDAAARLNALRRLWDDSPDAYALVSKINHAACDLNWATDRLQQLRRMFDQAAEISPDAAVALYSLGRRDLLDFTTSDIVALIRSWRLIDRSSIVAEIGCGTGRLLHSLAPHVGAIIGLDISGAMLRVAVEQVRQFSNVMALQTAGADLTMLDDATCDLVLAVDSFPYLVQAGVAEIHIAECARVLKPGGHALIMNWDYSSGLDAQRQEVAALAAKHAFAPLRNGTADLQSWDGKAFLLQKSGLGPEQPQTQAGVLLRPRPE